MVNNNQWVAWVAVIALVLAVVVLVVVLKGGVTGEAIFGVKKASVPVQTVNQETLEAIRNARPTGITNMDPNFVGFVNGDKECSNSFLEPKKCLFGIAEGEEFYSKQQYVSIVSCKDDINANNYLQRNIILSVQYFCA